MDYTKAYYWYHVLEVDVRYKDRYRVGEIYGFLTPLVGESIVGYDKKTGSFYPKCTLKFIGMNPPGLDEEGIKEWVGKELNR